MNKTIIEILAYMDKIPASAEKTAIMREIFGRSSDELVPLYRNLVKASGGMDGLKEAMLGGSEATKKQIEEARKLDEAFDDIHLTIVKIKNAILELLIPAIQSLLRVVGLIGPSMTSQLADMEKKIAAMSAPGVKLDVKDAANLEATRKRYQDITSAKLEAEAASRGWLDIKSPSLSGARERAKEKTAGASGTEGVDTTFQQIKRSNEQYERARMELSKTATESLLHDMEVLTKKTEMMYVSGDIPEEKYYEIRKDLLDATTQYAIEAKEQERVSITAKALQEITDIKNMKLNALAEEAAIRAAHEKGIAELAQNELEQKKLVDKAMIESDSLTKKQIIDNRERIVDEAEVLYEYEKQIASIGLESRLAAIDQEREATITLYEQGRISYESFFAELVELIEAEKQARISAIDAELEAYYDLLLVQAKAAEGNLIKQQELANQATMIYLKYAQNRMKIENDSLNENLRLNKEYFMKLGREFGGMTAAMERAWADWLTEAGNETENWYRSTEDVLDLMEDSFSELFEDALSGELESFADFFEDFSRSLNRIWAEMLVSMIKNWLTSKTNIENNPINAQAGVSGGGYTGGTGGAGISSGSIGYGGGMVDIGKIGSAGGSGVNWGGAVGGAMGIAQMAYTFATNKERGVSKGQAALTGVMQGASTGAMIGSIIPGIGTVVGAIVGGIIGLVGGLLSGGEKHVPGKISLAYSGDYLEKGHLGEEGGWQAYQKPTADKLGFTMSTESLGDMSELAKATVTAFKEEREYLKENMTKLGIATDQFNRGFQFTVSKVTEMTKEEIQARITDWLNTYATDMTMGIFNKFIKQGEGGYEAINKILLYTVEIVRSKNFEMINDLEKGFEDAKDAIRDSLELLKTGFGSMKELSEGIKKEIKEGQELTEEEALSRKSILDLINDYNAAVATGDISKAADAFDILGARIDAFYVEVNRVTTALASISIFSGKTFKNLDESIDALYKQSKTPIFDAYVDNMKKLDTALRAGDIEAATNALDGLAKSIYSLAEGALNIHQTITGFREDIKVSGMSEAEKTGYYKSEYDKTKRELATAQEEYNKAKTAGNVEGMVKFADQIETLMNTLIDQAKNLLGSEGGERYRKGIDKDLTKLDEFMTTLMADMKKISEETNAAIQDLIKNIMNDLKIAIEDLGKSLQGMDLSVFGQEILAASEKIATYTIATENASASISKLSSAAASAANALAAAANAPAHQSGLDYVPYSGYRSVLHRGEAVITAEGNKALSIIAANVAANGGSGQPIIINVSGDIAPLIKVSANVGANLAINKLRRAGTIR
jgi:hypothetical protein